MLPREVEPVRHPILRVVGLGVFSFLAAAAFASLFLSLLDGGA